MRLLIPALRALLCATLKSFRLEKNWSQERMADMLHISTRSYVDLEHGKFLCSAPVLLFFLTALPSEELLELMEKCKETITRAFHDAA